MTYYRDNQGNRTSPIPSSTKAFWRGFIETAGTISMSAADLSPSGKDYEYPSVTIKDTIYPILKSFMQEEIMQRNDSASNWDEQ